MNTEVHRLIAHAKPHPDHPRYFEWQTATIVVFVAETDRTQAQALADREMRDHGWERIEFIERATLIEERVRREGGAVLAAFLDAQAGVPFFLEELDEIAFATKDRPPMSVRRLTESFLDGVVLAAGGKRIDIDRTSPNRPKTADYRLGDLILELKDLQCEGMDVKTRQAKVAELFAARLRPDKSAIVDPSILSDSEYSQYRDIVGEPVKKALRDAGRQVRATLDRFSEPQLLGGAILLNTGYGSMSPNLLEQLASEYVARSSTLSVVVCISAWTLTNGFDSEFMFAFEPNADHSTDVDRLRSAFWSEIDDMITEWGRGGFQPPSSTTNPLRPIVFKSDKGIFAVPSPKPHNSIEPFRVDKGRDPRRRPRGVS